MDAQPKSGLSRHHFLLRRLHSLSGIVPIGVFLIAHLVTNSSILWGGFALRHEAEPGAGLIERGEAYFQHEVTWINTQVPHLMLIEVTLWLSIAFHAILGVYYARSGKANTSSYKYQGNVRYTLQRLTGYIAILYIFYHVATLRWGWAWLTPSGVAWTHDDASRTLALALKGSVDGITLGGAAVTLFYFVGITASVYHFANGLWTSAITWGLTVSTGAMRRWGMACVAIGAGLMLMAWGSLLGFLLVDADDSKMTPPIQQTEVQHP